MLVEVSISCWSAKKLAKKETEELTTAKSAAKSAAKVQKNLLVDDPKLAQVNKYAADTRNWLARVTVPWSDAGARLVSTAQFMDFKKQLDVKQQEFDALVADFLNTYATMISAQAFKLGSMFDRSEYPDNSEVAKKFGLRYSFTPVPEAGDFRVDIADEIASQLRDEYAAEYQRRVDAVNREHWDRLKDVLDRMSERLGVESDGKNKVFRDTLVDNALELCDLLRDTNVTGDQALDAARREVEQALLGITPKDLRTNDATRADVKSQVDSILDKFAF
jgi:hypothetical protein